MRTKHTKKSKTWHVALWFAQVVLAGMFLMVGFMKTFVPLPELSKTLPMAAELPILIRFIGISELAGGVGLLLPAALRVLPRLTIIAAYALGLVMVLALVFHVFRGEYSATGTNIVLAFIALFIGWGRTYKAPISPRTHTANAIWNN